MAEQNLHGVTPVADRRSLLQHPAGNRRAAIRRRRVKPAAAETINVGPTNRELEYDNVEIQMSGAYGDSPSTNSPPSGRERKLFLVVDPLQFSSLLERLTPKRRNVVSIEDALRILQMVAILTAALWTWNEYREYKRESQTLELARDRLEVAQRQLTIDLTSLDARLKRADVSASDESPIGFDIETNVQQITRQRHQAQIKMRVRNQSKHPIVVKTAWIELLVGSLSARPTPKRAVQLNGPTDRTGPIHWTRVFAHYYAANELASPKTLPNAGSSFSFGSPAGFPFSFGSPAFGRLIAGDDSNFESHEYHVVAARDQWIGFVEVFSIETQNKEAHTYSLYQWRAINEEGWQDARGWSIDAVAK